jgi:hypothetical protein
MSKDCCLERGAILPALGDSEGSADILAEIMMPKRTLVVVIGASLCAAAGMATASGFYLDQQMDYFASGKHLFYVWCPGADNYRATADGANGQDAQMRLYAETKAIGRKCWPVWQGHVRSRLAT